MDPVNLQEKFEIRSFTGVPVAPGGPYWGQPGSRDLNLLDREIIFEEFQPM